MDKISKINNKRIFAGAYRGRRDHLGWGEREHVAGAQNGRRNRGFHGAEIDARRKIDNLRFRKSAYY